MTHPEDSTTNGSNSGSESRSLVPYRDSAQLAVPMLNGDSDFEPDNSLRLRDYWFMIRSRLWLVAAITFLVTSLAVVYVARQPDVYDADARIQVDLENNPALPTKNGSVIINAPDDPAYFNTQLLLLKSPAFLRRVAKSLNGDQSFPWTAAPRNSVWQNIFRMTGLGGDRSRSRIDSAKLLRAKIADPSPDGDITEAQRLEPYVQALRAGLDVKLAETSRLININFVHSEPVVAATVVNVVADTFVEANWERRTTSTTAAGDFLQKRIAELQTKITENDRKLIAFAREHETFQLNAGTNMQSDRLASLDKGLLDAETARKVAEAEYQTALAQGAAEAIVEGSNNSQLNTLDARLAELRQKRAIMLIDTGENWPEVKELDKEIALLEDRVNTTRENAIKVVLTNLDTRYRQALAREQKLRQAFEQQHSSAMNENTAAIDYRMIQQETNTYRGLLDSLLQRSKENDVIRAATPNNVHVTDYATVPTQPVAPKRLRIVGLAFMVSLGFAVGFVILLGAMEDSVPVDSVERVERMFGLPALTVVPAITRRHQLPAVNAVNAVNTVNTLLRRNGNGTNGNGRPGLLLHGDMHSSLAEAYKKLWTWVLLSPGKRIPKVLLVTSSLPSEGKTTAVINTGLVISKTTDKVLLIDADMRHPGVHSILNIENEQGLSTILNGDFSHAEALAMIQQYEETNLYVLSSGPLPENPSELLGSEKMRTLLGALAPTFSHIIIDSPPVSFFTDALLISTMVDGVLMVIRGPKSPREATRHSIQSLDGVGAPLLGVVLNAVNVLSNNYSYYRHYYK